MKSEKAMSHITATIAIVIIAIIIAVGIRFILNEKQDNEVVNLFTDMLLVQGKVKVVSQENTMKKDERPLVGKKVSENLEDEKVKALLDAKVINEEEEDFENYYIIDSESISELNLPNNLNGEYYIVNYETYEIVHTKGIEIDGKMYYTLTSLLKYEEEKELEKQKDDTTNSEITNEEQVEEVEETEEEKKEE